MEIYKMTQIFKILNWWMSDPYVLWTVHTNLTFCCPFFALHLLRVFWCERFISSSSPFPFTLKFIYLFRVRWSVLFFRNFFPIPELIFGITCSFSSFGGRTFLFFVGLYTTAAIFSIQASLLFVFSFSMMSPLSMFLFRRIKRYFVTRILLNNLLRIKIINVDNTARNYYIPCPLQKGHIPV